MTPCNDTRAVDDDGPIEKTNMHQNSDTFTSRGPRRAFPWRTGLIAVSCLFVSSAASAQAHAGVANALLPHDLSAWSMFLSADWVVKAVMIGLAWASVVTWTVLCAKSVELSRAMREQRLAWKVLDQARTLTQAGKQIGDGNGASVLVVASQTELRLSLHVLDDRDGVKERIASRLERLEAAASRRMARGTGVLATVGATAPFVGLFGTVWGIMNSFIGISKSQITNLAVVAPGIAEALLATACGLVAAIPAVVIYNHFARRTATYKALVADNSAAVLRLVSRDLSSGTAGIHDAKAESAAE